MTVYLVFVKSPNNGRYLDSIWASQQAALKRFETLHPIINTMTNMEGWKVLILNGCVEDAAITSAASDDVEKTR